MIDRREAITIHKPSGLFVVLLLLCFSAVAQLNISNFSQISEKEGLNSNNVNAVLTDDLGYIWAATYNGPAKYNGYEFEKFFSDPTDSTAIQGMITQSIMQARDGKIWMGTNPGYIEVYNPATRKFYHSFYGRLLYGITDGNPLFGYTVTSMCEDNKGRIYFGISTGGGEIIHAALLYKEPNDTTIHIFNTPAGQEIHNVSRIKKDKKGNVWVLGYSGLSKIEPGGNLTSINTLLKKLPSRENEFISDFDFSNDGRIWLLSQLGWLVLINPQSGEYRSVDHNPAAKDPARYFNTLAIDPSGQIWVGSNSGMQVYLPESQTFLKVENNKNKELDQVSVNNFYFDPSGKLYVATANQGILRLEETSKFRSIIGSLDDKTTILPGWVNFIMESNDGKIWLHTDQGISVLDKSTRIVESRLDNSVSPLFQYSQCFWEYKPGEFYLSYGPGLLYSFSTRFVKPVKTSLPGLPEKTNIQDHLIDLKGNEWLATRKGLYRKAKSEESFRHYDLSTIGEGNQMSNETTQIIQSKHKGIWMASNNGLYFFNYETEKVERYGFDRTKGDVFNSQDINSIYEDKEGILWVGQWQGGLARFDLVNGQLRNYSLMDGLPSMVVQSIMGDEKNGMIWLSTFNGITRFDPKKEQFSNYSIEDGIQGSLFADGAVLKTSSGQIIFGGANGITLFNPDSMRVKIDPPKVFLTDFRLFNKSVLPGQGSILKDPIYKTNEVVLNHDQNNISIEFIALDYSNPLKNKYAYQLENFDPEWREVVNQRQAFYPKLPPGKYTFRVKAANDRGVWNETGATLQITINPPWWQSWWAYCIYGALLVVLIYLIHRYQKNQVIKGEREKARKKELEQAREIEKAYHELKTTQQQLIQSEKMASLGELTAGIAHEIQNPLNFVNNFSEVNKELIDEANLANDSGKTVEIRELLANLKSNQEKIKMHGDRADAIIKSMLLHSRTSTGQKILTDINALCEEYLRLAYHGMRAKDGNFQTEWKTGFDPSLTKISVVPQDIGRVLLNLYNNAFQAVSEKAGMNGSDYEPLVSVNTSSFNGKIEIRVADNGVGIPDSIKEKIFQPFFTTKPTGQGTGLGLSLSYDIIKAHGGTIELGKNTEKGTVFIITIPGDSSR